MKRTGRKQEWSLTIFAFGTVVFFPPIIGLFDKPVLVFGLPLAFLVVFGVWMILILGIWLGVRPARLRGVLGTPGPEGGREPTFEQVETHFESDVLGSDVVTPSQNKRPAQPSSPAKEG